jgi:hypothetical protein
LQTQRQQMKILHEMLQKQSGEGVHTVSYPEEERLPQSLILMERTNGGRPVGHVLIQKANLISKRPLTNSEAERRTLANGRTRECGTSTGQKQGCGRF